jgi:hypothetical protein
MVGSKRKERAIDSKRNAVLVVNDKEMGFLTAAEIFNITRCTLPDCVNSAEFKDRLCCSGGRKCVLGNELESEIAKYSQIMDDRFFGLGKRDIRFVAYQLAMKNNMQHFSDDLRKWLGKMVEDSHKKTPKISF